MLCNLIALCFTEFGVIIDLLLFCFCSCSCSCSCSFCLNTLFFDALNDMFPLWFYMACFLFGSIQCLHACGCLHKPDRPAQPSQMSAGDLMLRCVPRPHCTCSSSHLLFVSVKRWFSEGALLPSSGRRYLKRLVNLLFGVLGISVLYQELKTRKYFCAGGREKEKMYVLFSTNFCLPKTLWYIGSRTSNILPSSGFE